MQSFTHIVSLAPVAASVGGAIDRQPANQRGFLRRFFACTESGGGIPASPGEGDGAGAALRYFFLSIVVAVSLSRHRGPPTSCASRPGEQRAPARQHLADRYRDRGAGRTGDINNYTGATCPTTRSGCGRSTMPACPPCSIPHSLTNSLLLQRTAGEIDVKAEGPGIPAIFHQRNRNRSHSARLRFQANWWVLPGTRAQSKQSSDFPEIAFGIANITLQRTAPPASALDRRHTDSDFHYLPIRGSTGARAHGRDG